MSSGLMKPTPKESDLMKDIKRAFGPVSSTPVSLEQQLQRLNESELNLVLTTAQLVKLAHGFKAGNTQSYSSLVTSMYPKIKPTLRSLIAELLQDADPIPDAVEVVVASPRVDPREQVLSEYEVVLSQRPTDTLTAQTEKQDNPALQAYYQIVKEQEEATGASTNTGNDDFLARLTQSESSGNSQAEFTVKDGRRFVGSLQFGAARLADFKKHSGKRFTQDEFKADEALQDEVAQWHVAEIDKTIDALGDAAKGYDRDGLRSVAHLGGTGGMKRYVQSGGKYNPSDELGTSLKDYYDKFSSGGGA